MYGADVENSPISLPINSKKEILFIFSNFRGLFITINDMGHIYDILCNWTEPDVKVIVSHDFICYWFNSILTISKK